MAAKRSHKKKQVVVAPETKVVETPSEQVAKPMHKSTERSGVKQQYVRELLTANPYMGTEEILGALASKFPGTHPKRPGGVARTTISNIRMEMHGLRIGPRGKFFDRENKRVEVPTQFVTTPNPKPVRQAAANPESSAMRLEAFNRELRALMERAGVERVEVEAHGDAKIAQVVERVIRGH